MRLFNIFLLIISAAFCRNVNCNPVDLDLEFASELDAESKFRSSSNYSGLQEDEREITITMTTTTATATDFEVLQDVETTTTQGNLGLVKEKTLQRGKCEENRNRTKSKSASERLIPYPLCKPIQGVFFTGLCAVVCGLPFKSTENTCRFSNEDKLIFCNCDGAEEGDSATCGEALGRASHCRNPELAPKVKLCRAICRKLGKSYDFCTSPNHARRGHCTCFDASRSQKKGNSRETQDIPEDIPAQEFARLEAALKQDEIQDGGDDANVDLEDVDIEDVDVEEESCDNDDGPKNGTVIQKLRQKNTGSCNPVLSAYTIKVCGGICGPGAKSCRVNKAYKNMYCDCPGKEVQPTGFCGKHAEMYKHCFATSVTPLKDCRSLCSELGKRGEICLSPENSATRTMCSCFIQ